MVESADLDMCVLFSLDMHGRRDGFGACYPQGWTASLTGRQSSVLENRAQAEYEERIASLLSSWNGHSNMGMVIGVVKSTSVGSSMLLPSLEDHDFCCPTCLT